MVIYFYFKCCLKPFGDALPKSQSIAIKNVEISCEIGLFKDYPILSFFLLAKISFAENDDDTTYFCLIEAIKQPVKTTEVCNTF